jgi:uncharacterized protein YjbI with pentapeptide repeats
MRVGDYSLFRASLARTSGRGSLRAEFFAADLSSAMITGADLIGAHPLRRQPYGAELTGAFWSPDMTVPEGWVLMTPAD